MFIDQISQSVPVWLRIPALSTSGAPVKRRSGTLCLSTQLQPELVKVLLHDGKPANGNRASPRGKQAIRHTLERNLEFEIRRVIVQRPDATGRLPTNVVSRDILVRVFITIDGFPYRAASMQLRAPPQPALCSSCRRPFPTLQTHAPGRTRHAVPERRALLSCGRDPRSRRRSNPNLLHVDGDLRRGSALRALSEAL